MRINYSPQLMEEAVFRHLNHRERSGMRADYDEYHSLADPIYELPEDDRETAFAKVNDLFFREKLELGDNVLQALEACGLIPKRQKTAKKALAASAESAGESGVAVAEGDDGPEESESEPSKDAPAGETERVETLEDTSAPVEDTGEVQYEEEDRSFEEKIKEITIKRAINKVDEGSNVLNRVSGLPVIEMRVLASRFANPEEVEELGSFLIHEFMHARDMMDPQFDYEDAFIPGNPSMKNLITARFRLLWNIYVDSRLARKKIRSVLTREARYREFDNYYRKIPEQQRQFLGQDLPRNSFK